VMQSGYKFLEPRWTTLNIDCIDCNTVDVIISRKEDTA
jgi:hypothetical protein